MTRAAPVTIVRHRGARRKPAQPARPDDLRVYLEGMIEEAMCLPQGWVVLLDYVAARAPGGWIWFSAREADATLYAKVLRVTRPEVVVTVKAAQRYAQMLDEQMRWLEAVVG